jgi:hypothetical protein
MSRPLSTSDGIIDQLPPNCSQFMATIFAGAVGVPIVAAPDFKGFISQRYRDGYVRGEQAYFCISTVKDIPRHAFLGRQLTELVRTYCIVLDDIGTKVPIEKITVPPTWILESSPGNFQYGYRLEGGADPMAAEALVDSLIDAKFSDPGAHSANRVMRLPDSLNAKPQHNGWRAKVTLWQPEVAYTIVSLAQAFGVAPGQGKAPEEYHHQDGPDPVFDWLLGQGMIKDGPNPRGWYAMVCPWEENHKTPPLDHGTDYRPGDPGAFKCLHGSCERQSMATLKAWIQDQDPTADIGVISHEMIADLGAKLREILMPSLTLRAQLALSIAHFNLGPRMLPDPATTAAGNVSMKQTATEVRVEHVLNTIGAKVRHNAMNGGIEITFPNYDSANDPSDAGMATIVHACDRCGMSKSGDVTHAVVNIARTNMFHPAEDWIRAEPWDGRDRLPDLVNTIEMRDPSQESWRNVAIKRWGLQVVAAILNYKRGDDALDVGHVLTLQGEQGAAKSRWVASLMPARFVRIGLSLKLDLNERDAATRATAKPIGELGELDGSFRRSDIAATKNFLTTPVDFYRAPYAKKEVPRPRCTAFAATVNPESFLIDATGHRRFWPLAVARCNYEHEINMQQFWAQMLHMFEHGEQYWLTNDELALHASATKAHCVETDFGFVVEDLVWRRTEFPDQETWIHRTSKEILERYNVHTSPSVYTNFKSALQREGFVRTTNRGKPGWHVPPYTAPLTPAEQAAFVSVKNWPTASQDQR